MARKASSKPADSTANLGFEAKLWLAADKLRNNMNAAEPKRSGDSQPQAARRASKAKQYKHVVLGLIFLSRAERDRSRASVTRRASRGLRVKYISDSFEEHHAELYDPACGSGVSFPASRLCGVRFAEKDCAIALSIVQFPGQDSRSVAETGEVKWARRQRPFGLAKRARRVRLRGQQPKQSNATMRRHRTPSTIARDAKMKNSYSNNTP